MVRGRMDYEVVKYEVADGVATVTLNNPEKRNMLSGQMLVELVDQTQPDVIVKGGDYSPDSVVGANEVRARGGDVVIIPLTPGHSTTSTIDRLRGR